MTHRDGPGVAAVSRPLSLFIHLIRQKSLWQRGNEGDLKTPRSHVTSSKPHMPPFPKGGKDAVLVTTVWSTPTAEARLLCVPGIAVGFPN
jgi:hypothetical protein